MTGETMNYSFKKHLISSRESIIVALEQLNTLALDAILFAVDDENRLIGSLTDGDVRRGLLRGLGTESKVEEFIQPNPKFIRKGAYDLHQIIGYRNAYFKILPVLNEENKIVNVVNFRFFKSYLPLDVVIMAGGRGQRLAPLTNSVPKPLLPVGDKPIIEHNIDRLKLFGIDDFWISLRYLGNQIADYLGDGESKDISIRYVWEEEALGTIGAVSQIKDFQHDHILVTNSDLLTNVDYEQFFLGFIESQADLAVATIPYKVTIPYAVLETDDNLIRSFKEKPTYTYYSNGGIYLMKKEVLQLLPESSFFNATDLMELMIEKGYKVFSYPLSGYWLDIGRHEDYVKAQEDIKHINF
jgi:dTDP-glucose pyrophosphorylase